MNIRDDFPIELNTKINREVECLQQRNNEAAEKYAIEILGMVDTFLWMHEETGNKRLYECAIYYPERKARNPKTGESIIAPERKVIRFKAKKVN